MTDQRPLAESGEEKPSRFRLVFEVLVKLCVSFAFMALLLEGGVLLVFGEQPKFPRHVVGADFGIRTNLPNASYRHKSADVNIRFEINSQGMRADRDFPYAKPAGLARIVSLGDSFTVGYEVDSDETFSSVLERELRASGRNVEVMNAGVSGFSTAEECVYFERELRKYDPDLVLISFYGNDFVDNVRTGLFRLEDGELEGGTADYVPMGRIANYLNSSWFFNLLGGYSNAFVLLKETATAVLKRQMVAENVRHLEQAERKDQGGEVSADTEASTKNQKELAVAILKRLAKDTHDAGIPLVIHSIPSIRPEGLIELFPVEEFGEVAGTELVLSRDVLLPHLEEGEQLYYDRSHGHWTPLSHELAGKLIADRIIQRRLLD